MGKEVSKKYEFVDLSGHPSQSHRVKKYCSNVQFVIFMIDSTDLQNINNASKMLYQLLSLKAFNSMSSKPKILIIGNKSDQPNTTTMVTIKATLIKELNKLHESNAASADEEDDEYVIIANKKDQTLKWDDLKYDISFGTCSVLEKKIDPILTFLK